MQGNRDVRCRSCNRMYCIQCKRKVHPDKTCEEYEQFVEVMQNREMFETTGMLFNHCPTPGCLRPYTVSNACQHVTCPRCTFDFCFLCAAPRSPILAHGNCYHRPSCEFYGTCCSKECVKTKPHCDDLDFQGNPSDPKYKCLECEKKGDVCRTPVPLDPTDAAASDDVKLFKILRKEDAERESASWDAKK